MALTKATFSMVEGATVNVLDFGADPTGSVDSYQAFRDAIDSLTSGGVVSVPDGNYKITQPIVFGSSNRSIAVQGYSARFPYQGDAKGSVITPDGTFPSARGLFEFTGTGSVSNDRTGQIKISDITVAGNSSLENAVWLKSARNVYFERCHFTASLPIRFTPTLTFIDFVRFTDCFVQASGGAGEAVKIEYTTSGDLAVTNVIFDGGWLLGGKTGGSCVYIDNVEGVEFRGTYFDSGNPAKTTVIVDSSSSLRASRPVMFFNILAEFVGTFLQVKGQGPNIVGIEGLRTLPSTATGYPLISLDGTGPHRVTMKNARLSSVGSGDPVVATTNNNARLLAEGQYLITASVYSSGAVSIANGGAGSNFSFDSEYYDLYSLHDNATNPSRVYLPFSGKWEIQYQTKWDTNTSGIRLTRIKLSGTDVPNSETIVGGTSRSTTACIQVDATGGNFAELYVYQDSGGALDLSYASMTVRYLGG